MTSSPERLNWRLLVLAWVLLVAVFYLPLLMHHTGAAPFTDNDDSMRLVTATDLADGQAWQDKLVHRDDAPFGMPLHWSRLVDAPLALLILVLRPFFGARAGEIAALVWPPMLLLPLLAISAGFTRRLVGPGHRNAAIVLPLLSMALVGEFAPGRVDHHNVQILLTTSLLWATISGRTSVGGAVAAGLLAATSLAIGIETLPFMVGAILAFALFWVRDPAAAGNTRGFAAAFALGSLGHFLLATPPHLYFVSACDELSATYVAASFLVGAALTLATLLGGRLKTPQRLVLVGVLGALAGVATLLLFPECRAGPYGALDSRAVALLLTPVTETRPLLAWFEDDPGTAFSLVSAPFIGLAIVTWCCIVEKGEKRVDWLVNLLFLVLAMAVMIAEVRGTRLAVMPAIPAGVWLISRARQAYVQRPGPGQAGGLIAAWLLFAGLFQFVAAALFTTAFVTTPAVASGNIQPPLEDCMAPSAYAPLAALPPGITIGPNTLGASILRYTADSVVSAGYHRNIDGSFAVDDFLNASEATAKTVAVERGVTYVVACRSLPQLAPAAYSTTDSFVALWGANKHWEWLSPVSTPGAVLTIYKIKLPG
jgi:hypothetical protein